MDFGQLFFVLEHLVCPASVVQRPSACASKNGDTRKTLHTHSLRVQQKKNRKGKLRLELTLESISCAFRLGLRSGYKTKEEIPQIERSY